MQQTINIYPVLATWKASKKTGLCPIHLSVDINGKRAAFPSLKRKILPTQWDAEKKKVVTVVDRVSPVIDTNQNDTLLGYVADMSTSWDYYPFGMLMPGRYTSDTQRHCVTTHTTVLVTKPIEVVAARAETVGVSYQHGADPEPPAVGELPKAQSFADEPLYVYHYNPIEEHSNGWVIQAVADDYTVDYTIDLSDEPGELYAYMQMHMDTNVADQSLLYGMGLNEQCTVEYRVRQYVDSTQEEYYVAVDWHPVEVSGSQDLGMPVDKTAVKAGGHTIVEWRIKSLEGSKFPAGTLINILTPKTYRTLTVPETRVTLVCDDKDNYRFGFNGIEKTNEIAGIGNHYTALFGEYDPRIVYRWNTDPKPNPSMSPYSMFAGNPILNKDPLLDTVRGVFYRNAKQLFLIDMDKYVKGLPIKVVKASDYKPGGIVDKNGKQTHNQWLRLDNVFSGGASQNGTVTRDPNSPQQKAIPAGNYSILDNNADTRHTGWFRLDAQDSEPYDDTHEGTGRTGFRFHLGTVSWGCVTCDQSAGDRTEEWNVVSDILNNTSTTTVKEKRGYQWLNPNSKLTNYGTIKVTGEDNIPQKQTTTNGQ